MAALLDDAASIEHHDLIGFADCGKAVGDDQSGALLDEVIDCRLNLSLGERVYAGSGLVEDD